MNKKQWFVIGFGLFLLSIYLFSFVNSSYCSTLELNDEQITSCYIKRYSYGIPANISLTLSLMFIICGFLEPKKK